MLVPVQDFTETQSPTIENKESSVSKASSSKESESEMASDVENKSEKTSMLGTDSDF